MSPGPAVGRPRRGAGSALAVALALLSAGTGLAGATQGTVLDYPTIDNPRSLLLGDSGAQARWQALFEPYPSWVSRQVAFLTWRESEKAPTLLAAGSLCLLLTVNEFGIVLFIGAKGVITLPLLIYDKAIQESDYQTACAIAIINVALSLTLFGIYRNIAKRLGA